MSTDASEAERLKASSQSHSGGAFFMCEGFGGGGDGGGTGTGGGLGSGSGAANDLEDFEPQPRDRCNTWPLQKQPGVILSQHTSPLIHEEIPEEEGGVVAESPPADSGGRQPGNTDLFASGGSSSDRTSGAGGDFGSGSTKRSTSRRNAWGNLSYADLITQAILSSPESRLTLSQIYEWMVKNVPYFRDKGDSNSSAGWKNSIRHNLSLHSRFMRVQNEGPGKSSWWVINPDAKSGKASRRRAGSMETSKNLEKKRGRVRKKIEQLRASVNSVGSLRSSSLNVLSPSISESSDLYDSGVSPVKMMPFALSPSGEFRHRSNSNVSNYSVGSSLSPKYDSRIDDWGDDVRSLQQQQQAQAPPFIPGESFSSDLVESMSQSMNLNEPPPYPAKNASSSNYAVFSGEESSSSRIQTSPGKFIIAATAQRQQLPAASAMVPFPRKAPHELSGSLPSGGLCNVSYHQPAIKSERPPPYGEVYPNLSHVNVNRMLRQVLQKSYGGNGVGATNAAELLDSAGGGGGGLGDSGPPTLQQMNLMQQQHQQYVTLFAQLNSSNNHQVPQVNTQLPSELSEIHYDTDIQCDIDQVIRHELNVAGTLDFSVDHFGNI